MSDPTRIKHAVVLAGGRGIRMSPLSDVVPKAMAPVHDTTLISLVIARIPSNVKVHITAGWLGGSLSQHVFDLGVASIHNTAGESNCWWIYNTELGRIDEPVFLFTCDNQTRIDLGAVEADYFDLGAPPNMVIPVDRRLAIEGDFVAADTESRVTALGPDVTSELCCSGMQVINLAQVREMTTEPESFRGVWTQLMENRSLAMSRVQPSSWAAVDTWDQLKTFAAENPAESLP